MSEQKPIKNLASAILAVMQDTRNGVEKNLDVGFGQNRYKGVADKDVKQIIGESMAKNGLIMMPTSIIPTMRIDRWEESYKETPKQKQSVFTEVSTTYKLIHVESGESMDIQGYGHGVDTQDKSAGKATTYALKYAMLYTFLVPTGTILDADSDHSDKHSIPQKPVKVERPKGKKEMSTEQFASLTERFNKGEVDVFKKAQEYFVITPAQKQVIKKLETAA